jgi:DNA recombination protein RmuC
MTVLLIILILVLAALVLLQLKKPVPDSTVPLLQQQLESLRQQMADSLKTNTEVVNHQLVSIIEQVNTQLNNVTSQMMSSQKNVGDRLDTAARVVADVQKSLGSLSQASERIFDIGKDISSLQEILRAPKLRGSLGELFLGDLLAQVLPAAHFTLQHAFRSGERVDAVVRLGDGVVPVDAKFPLEDFRRMLAAETEDVVANAREKLERKGCDLVVANEVGGPDGGFAADTNRVTLVSRTGLAEVEGTKEMVAEAILDRILPVLDGRRPLQG